MPSQPFCIVLIHSLNVMILFATQRMMRRKVASRKPHMIAVLVTVPSIGSNGKPCLNISKNMTKSSTTIGASIVLILGFTPSGRTIFSVFLIGTEPSLSSLPSYFARFCAFSIGPKSNCVIAIYPHITKVSTV